MVDGMDIGKLAQLAGLHLEESERRHLAPQLDDITRFCGGLPATTVRTTAGPATGAAPAGSEREVARPMDRRTALDNLPDLNRDRIITPSPRPETDTS